MKQLPESRLNVENLRRLYPLPDSLQARTQHTLESLDAKKEPIMKRKLSFALVLLIIALLAAGAYALSHYGVLDFLSVKPREKQLAPLTQKLGISQTVDKVSLTIDSALYDGEFLALDWTIANENPEQPRYVTLTRFEADGRPLSQDGTDSFDSQWLPGVFSEDGSMQDGELVPLPLETLTGEKARIVMEIDIITPKKPLFYLEQTLGGLTEAQQEAWKTEQDKLGEQKLTEGFIVMDEDAFFIPLPEEDGGGFARVIGSIDNFLKPEDYKQSALSASFDLDLSMAEKAYEPLVPREAYTFDFMTTWYEKAVKTPLGVYMTLYAKPTDGRQADFEELVNQGQASASDGDGNLIDVWPLRFEGLAHTFPDGSIGRKYILALPLGEKDQPEAISLTLYPVGGGAPLISAVPLR